MKRRDYTYFISSKELRDGLYGKWDLYRNIAKDKLTKSAQLKLEWIIFLETIGKRKVVPTARHFGINPKTLHKWKGRFDEKNLYSLEEHKRTPVHVRQWMVSPLEQERIKALRRANIKLGKRKLKELYINEYKENISTWKIERVIRRYNLYPEKNKHKYLVEKRAKKQG